MSPRAFGMYLGLIGSVPSMATGQSFGEVSMKIVTHSDVSLAAQTFGAPEDPALLLIMGATASMLGWPDAFCVKLAEHGLFVIRFDHRDTGQSTTVPPGKASYVVEDLAADAIAVLDGYGIERAHVLGMSLGGLIGQMIALDHPHRVRTLTLFASEPLGWDGEPLPHISPVFLEHFAGIQTLDWSDSAAISDFLATSERLSAGVAHQYNDGAVRARVSQVLARTESPASMFNHAMMTVRQDWTSRFREISVPVLVIHGEEDPILPVENGLAIAAGIDGAVFAGLAGVGHEIPIAVIEDLSDRIAAFIGR